MIQKSECRDNYAKENRILWIDNLRGVLIFFVVFGHVISGENSFLYSVYGYVHYLIYSIHMPVFFILSGYLAKNNFTFSKGLIHFFIPYAVFDFAYVCWSYLRGVPSSVNKVILFPSSVYWFILALGIINILAFKLTLKQFTLLSILMFSIFAFIPIDAWEFLALGRISLMMPAYLVGMLIKKYYCDFRMRKMLVLCGLVCICAELGLLFLKIVPITWSTHDFTEDKFQYALKFLYIVVFSVESFFFLARVVPNKKCILTRWGSNSIIIYLTHGVFLDIVKKVMIVKCGIYWLYWRKWMFFATFIATILLVEVLSFDIWKKVYDFIFLVPQKLMGYVKRKRFFRE